MSTPWQPGPWSIGDHGIVDANGKLVHRDPCGANVKLEVLAPTMADAILHYYKLRCGDFDAGDAFLAEGARSDAMMISLAAELRAIGSEA